MKRTIIFIVSCLAVLAIHAQAIRQAPTSSKAARSRESVISVRGNKTPPSFTPKKRLQPVIHKTSSSNGKNVMPDTVYSHSTTKQHGWRNPLGILTKEQASHRSFSYRFTHRNAKGHWGKMELIDGYGHYNTGNMNTYILKLVAIDTDTLANKEWAEKVESACIFEFIADATGEHVIQERAYDKDMNVIYIYSRTPIGKNKSGRQQYVGSYKDSYGLPAEMRKDTTGRYTYGTLVMLTEDKWGNDSVIEYIDAKGQKKVNSDGADMEIYVHDQLGRCIRQFYCDSVGKPIIDNWGNCDIEFAWNKDHTEESAMYVDANWKPMRMPTLREDSYNKGVIKTLYFYDEYKRIIERRFVDGDGNPDTNFYGAHKRITSYDEKGNVKERRWYDKNGHLAPSDNSQDAVYKYTYTSDGQTQDAFFYDKNEQPCSTPGYLSRIHYEYDDNGK
ncbi:MAG: hypothetical protein J5867_06955, partial [Prevotella sp.]|nr:hypothetical protein [Prevotella sp.]